MLRKILLTTAALPLFGFASMACAQVEIGDDLVDPIRSSTIDGGSPGDIIVLSGGTVLVSSGAAVTIDSDNTVTNDGSIGSTDADNTTGILITGGTTGGFINTGTIDLTEDFTPTDDDGDGDLDGPRAIGTGRTGILIEGPAAFNGDVLNELGGRITIEGMNSTGVSIRAGLNGDLINNGVITLIGENSYGIQITSVVNGDINNLGSISIAGENSIGISVEGDVNGTLNNTGQVSTSGFREPSRRQTIESRALLDADDLTQGGPGISVSANISGGFINGIERDENDLVVRIGTVLSQGSEPAVRISAGLDGQPGGDVTLGAVGSAQDGLDYGFINQGTITGSGINDGFAASTIQVQGAEVNSVMRRAVIERGILNSGAILGSSFDAATRTVWLRDGAVVDTLNNTGRIGSSVISQIGGQAITIAVDNGAQINSIVNSGRLEAFFTGSGTGAQAVVISDDAGTVDLVENEGQIIAVFTEFFPAGVENDPTDTTRRTVAIDLSANTGGAIVRQQGNVDLSADPSITGDIILGSGDDLVELTAGTVTGDIVFGDGADTLTIDGGAELAGAIQDSDGLLTINVQNGLLELGSATALNLTDATFGANSRLQMTLSPSDTGIDGATFNATGGVTFLDGATISPVLNGLIGDGGTFNFLQASALNVEGMLQSLLVTDQLPFLYDVTLRQGGSNNTLVLDLRRRTADELGLDVNQASVYDPWFAALSASGDTGLGSGFARLTTSGEFDNAFNQLLPEFGAAALQFTLANTDGTTGAVASRLDNVRRGYSQQGGLWAQEIGYYLTRNLSSISQPYRGFGLGLAVGIDRSFGPFDAVGIVVSGFSNEISQINTFDKPLTSKSIQVGVYSGGKVGNFNFETHSAIGFDDFNSERVLKFGDISRTANADWTGYHFANTSRISYNLTNGKWFVRPSLSLDQLWLREKSYTETGGGTAVDLAVQSRTSKSLSAAANLTFGRKYSKPDGSWWSPRLRAGVRNEFQGSAPDTVARFSGFDQTFTLSPEELSDVALLLGFSFTAGSRFSSFGFDYDADIRDGFIRHTGRLVIRFIF